MKNQSGGVDVGSEKLYTQDEVNNLRKDWKESHSSQAREIEKETQTADKQKRLNNRKVAKLVKKSNRILVSISSHKLPFDLFPDTINIEEGRITIITRQLLSSEVHSVDIKDISNIFINTSFFFSQLIIISKTFEENEIRIRNLRTKEAIFVRRIIEGLRIFENKQIDTSGYTKGKYDRNSDVKKRKGRQVKFRKWRLMMMSPFRCFQVFYGLLNCMNKPNISFDILTT